MQLDALTSQQVPLRSRPAAWPLILTLSLLAGCGDDETSAKIQLSLDPRLNTEQQLLTSLEQIELIFGAKDGFPGVTAAGQRAGDMSAHDIDGDGTLELVLKRDLAGRGELPRFRLLPGGSVDRLLSVTVRGHSGGELRAMGKLDSLRFYHGESRTIEVPFDLLPAFRAPRVRLSTPEDGQTSVPKALGRVSIEFSKLINTKTLPGQMTLYYTSWLGLERTVPGDLLLGTKEVSRDGLKERRTSAAYQLGCSLNPGSYRLVVTSQVTDLAGTRLDQNAASDGHDSYEGSFSIAGTAQDDPCGTPVTCTTDPECNAPGMKIYRCASGACVPIKEPTNCCLPSEIVCKGHPDKGVVCTCPKVCT